MSSSRFALAFLVLGMLLVSSQALTTYVYNYDTVSKYTPSYELGYIMSGTSIMLNVSTINLIFKDTSFVLATGNYPSPQTIIAQKSTTCIAGGSSACVVIYDITISGTYRIKLNAATYPDTPAKTDGTVPNKMELFQMGVTSYLTLSGGPSNSTATINSVLKVSDTFRDRVAKLIYLDSTQTSTFSIYPYPTTLSSALIAANAAVLAANNVVSLEAASKIAADNAETAATVAKNAAAALVTAAAAVTGTTAATYAATTTDAIQTATAAVVTAISAAAGATIKIGSVATDASTAQGLILTASLLTAASTITTQFSDAVGTSTTGATGANTNAGTLVTQYGSGTTTSAGVKAAAAVSAVAAGKTFAASALTAALAVQAGITSSTAAAQIPLIATLVDKANALVLAIATTETLVAAQKTAADLVIAATVLTKARTQAALDAISAISAAYTTAAALVDAAARTVAIAAVFSDKSNLISLNLFKSTTATSPYVITSVANSLLTSSTPPAVLTYSPSTQTLTATVNLTQGYYVLVSSYGIPYTSFIRLTFPSNSYSCPYSSLFPDYYLNFQPCSSSGSDSSSALQPGYPCLSLNSVTKICAACVSGYVLVNGTCLVNTTCPAGQYFHFGSCVPVDSSCDKYDSFSGVCTTCKNTTYIIVNGKCVAPEVNCTARQYNVNNTCFNASDLCKAFDAAGACTSCYDGYEVKNGSCSLIVPVCTSKQYLKDNKCKDVPTNCPSFDIKSESCVTCDRGYYVSNGVCQKIECPAGQVPSTYGVFCVSVSPLCATYDPLTGDCFACKNKDEIVSNGVCIQISSAIAGCMAREKLGFGPCTDAVKNCQRYNLQSGECEQCITGWFKDYTGKCSLQNAVCQSDEVSIDGICVQVPQNCLKVDNIGLCSVCQTAEYHIVNGQCVLQKTCDTNQYLGDNGQCVEVAPGCSSFNPTTGSCLVCANGSPANNGLCCPDGYSVLSGQCIDPNTYQSIKSAADTSSVPTCVAYHPSLGTCLACNGKFQVDVTTGNSCI